MSSQSIPFNSCQVVEFLDKQGYLHNPAEVWFQPKEGDAIKMWPAARKLRLIASTFSGIKYSDDWGKSWKNTNNSSWNPYFNLVDFNGTLLASKYDYWLMSTDRGITWSQFSRYNPASFFVFEGYLYSSEVNGLYKTHDLRNFTKLGSYNVQGYNTNGSIACSGNTMLVCGATGNLKLDRPFTSVNWNSYSYDKCFWSNKFNKFYTCYSSTLRSSSDGVTWSTVVSNTGTLKQAYGIGEFGNYIIASSSNSVKYSEDGVTFKDIYYGSSAIGSVFNMYVTEACLIIVCRDYTYFVTDPKSKTHGRIPLSSSNSNDYNYTAVCNGSVDSVLFMTNTGIHDYTGKTILSAYSIFAIEL